MNRNTIFAFIAKIINTNCTSNGRALYFLQNQFSVSLGDESEQHLEVWNSTGIMDTAGFDDDDSDEVKEAMDIDTRIGQLINQWKPSDEPLIDGWKKIFDEGLKMIWVNASGDMISVHYADHSIHVNQLNSGQY